MMIPQTLSRALTPEPSRPSLPGRGYRRAPSLTWCLIGVLTGALACTGKIDTPTSSRLCQVQRRARGRTARPPRTRPARASRRAAPLDRRRRRAPVAMSWTTLTFAASMRSRTRIGAGAVADARGTRNARTTTRATRASTNWSMRVSSTGVRSWWMPVSSTRASLTRPPTRALRLPETRSLKPAPGDRSRRPLPEARRAGGSRPHRARSGPLRSLPGGSFRASRAAGALG